MVGGDVVDGVGCGLAGVDLHGAHCGAVDEGLDAEVEVGLRAGDGGAEVVIGGADLDDGGVVAVDLDDGGCRRAFPVEVAELTDLGFQASDFGDKYYWKRRMSRILGLGGGGLAQQSRELGFGDAQWRAVGWGVPYADCLDVEGLVFR